MTDQLQEVLVILGAPDDQHEIERHGQITHAGSGRVLVVRGGPAELARLPGVTKVITGGETEDVLPEGLSAGESLFARGWLLGQKPKGPRPGEGLPWDSPGYQPPDPKP